MFRIDGKAAFAAFDIAFTDRIDDDPRVHELIGDIGLLGSLAGSRGWDNR
jgi:hypothetical protein